MRFFLLRDMLLAMALLTLGCGGAGVRQEEAPRAVEGSSGAPVFGEAFWKHWADGQAEIAGYDLSFPRYGELRRGVAVTIFVTETFSDSIRVKADPGKHQQSSLYPVMKLNLIQDFQTGVYDYNLMTSSFVALAPVSGRRAGSPAKVSFSSQEWCGHVYGQLLFDATEVRHDLHSYFDGEADQQDRMPYPSDGLTEDALWHWARGLAWPALDPGETREVSFLPSLQSSRLGHTALAWTRATVSRSRSAQQISVPAGNLEVEAWSASMENGRSRTFYVEKAAPQRIAKWETSDGERAELLGSDRLKYWQMQGEGAETALRKIGLSRRPGRMP